MAGSGCYALARKEKASSDLVRRSLLACPVLDRNVLLVLDFYPQAICKGDVFCLSRAITSNSALNTVK
jgi:hypothetical protein